MTRSSFAFSRLAAVPFGMVVALGTTVWAFLVVSVARLPFLAFGVSLGGLDSLPLTGCVLVGALGGLWFTIGMVFPEWGVVRKLRACEEFVSRVLWHTLEVAFYSFVLMFFAFVAVAFYLGAEPGVADEEVFRQSRWWFLFAVGVSVCCAWPALKPRSTLTKIV